MDFHSVSTQTRASVGGGGSNRPYPVGEVKKKKREPACSYDNIVHVIIYTHTAFLKPFWPTLRISCSPLEGRRTRPMRCCTIVISKRVQWRSLNRILHNTAVLRIYEGINTLHRNLIYILRDFTSNFMKCLSWKPAIFFYNQIVKHYIHIRLLYCVHGITVHIIYYYHTILK